jgi:hypothetical protein
MTGEPIVSRIGPIRWRARAYQPRFSDDGPSPYVSEISGEATLEQRDALPAHPNQQLLLVVRKCIEIEMERRRPLDPSALLFPFMTVTVDRFALSDTTPTGERDQVARIDLIIDGGVASAVADGEGIGLVRLEDTPVQEGDRAWEVIVRLLRSVDERSYRGD